MNNLQDRLCEKLVTEGRYEEQIKEFLQIATKESKITDKMLFSEVKMLTNEYYQGLLKYFYQMPKGAFLHVQSTTGLDAERLLEQILQWNRLGQDRREEMKIYYLKEENIEKKLPYATLMFKVQFNEMGISDEKIEKVTEQNKENVKKELYFNSGVKKNRNECNIILTRTKMLFTSKEFYRVYHQKFFEFCIDNNIPYIEMRTCFQKFTDFSKKEEIAEGIIFLRENFTTEDYFYHQNMLTDTNPKAPDIEFLKQIKLAQKQAVENKKTEKNGIEFEVKVVLTANRNTKPIEVENILKKLDTAIVIRNRFNEKEDNIPEVIGFDLVSCEKEDTEKTEDLAPYFFMKFGEGYDENTNEESIIFTRLKEEKRIDLVRLFLHDGQNAEWKNNEYERDVRRNIILPQIMKICPIHNQLSGSNENLQIQKYQGKALREKEVFAVICSDNPQVFDNSGLTYDYLIAYADKILDYDRIKISVFLGYFYREMSRYYYVKNKGDSISIVNYDMKYGKETDNLEDWKENKGEVTKSAVINKAIQKFNRDWTVFIEKCFE